jgi:uncharacterized SAM-binding protein YcdF (DUF218 family)
MALTAFGLRLFLKTLFIPPAGLLLVGLAGLLCGLRRPRLGLALCAVAIGGIWLLGMPLVADALAHAVEGFPALDPAHLTPAQSRAQVIVVLAGGVRRDAPDVGGDAPALHVVPRLVEAAKIARATHLPLLVSGNPREAAAMCRFLLEEMRLPVAWAEGASWDTRENAEFSARILHPLGLDRIILVTSSAHLVRAAAEFRAAGFEVSGAPAEMLTRDERGMLAFLPSVQAWDRSRTALYEWVGRIVQWTVETAGRQKAT